MNMIAAHGLRVLSASSLKGDDVVDAKDEKLGTVEELMINLESGRIAYAVLSFGTFMGMGGKLFAIPWSALSVDTVEKRLVLDVAKERLENAPGFDKDNWPDMADQTWGAKIYSYYGTKPYWE
jgi:sporulation protein YlmC with PRC-barrel domain